MSVFGEQLDACYAFEMAAPCVDDALWQEAVVVVRFNVRRWRDIRTSLVVVKLFAMVHRRDFATEMCPRLPFRFECLLLFVCNPFDISFCFVLLFLFLFLFFFLLLFFLLLGFVLLADFFLFFCNLFIKFFLFFILSPWTNVVPTSGFTVCKTTLFRLTSCGCKTLIIKICKEMQWIKKNSKNN